MLAMFISFRFSVSLKCDAAHHVPWLYLLPRPLHVRIVKMKVHVSAVPVIEIDEAPPSVSDNRNGCESAVVTGDGNGCGSAVGLR